MTQKFYLSRHKNGIWYARFVDQETGNLIASRSTKEYNKKAAEAKCYEWLNAGLITSSQNKKRKLKITTRTIITQIAELDATAQDARELINALKAKGLIESVVFKHSPASEKASDFLRRFWNWDLSPYIQEKKLYKHTIHKFYTHRNEGYIEKYWVPFLEEKSLGAVTKQDIKAFQKYIGGFDLSPESMNQITRCGVTAFKWAYNNELTEHNCFDGLTFCAITHQKREVLTPEQAALIFSQEWDSPYSKLANLTAMMTGMRAGEIQALRMEDIGKDRIYVRHSWGRGKEGLKTPKNGEEREIPIPEVLRDALLNQGALNPYNEGLQGYIFFGLLPKQPMDSKPWLTALRRILKKVGFSNPEKICFHAWRHFYSARMADLIDQRKLQRATGHKTAAMLEHYANHAKEQDFIELKQTAETLFLPLLKENN